MTRKQVIFLVVWSFSLIGAAIYCYSHGQTQGRVLHKSFRNGRYSLVIRNVVGLHTGIETCEAPKWVYDQAQEGYWAYTRSDFSGCKVLMVE